METLYLRHTRFDPAITAPRSALLFTLTAQSDILTMEFGRKAEQNLFNAGPRGNLSARLSRVLSKASIFCPVKRKWVGCMPRRLVQAPKRFRPHGIIFA